MSKLYDRLDEDLDIGAGDLTKKLLIAAGVIAAATFATMYFCRSNREQPKPTPIEVPYKKTSMVPQSYRLS